MKCTTAVNMTCMKALDKMFVWLALNIKCVFAINRGYVTILTIRCMIALNTRCTLTLNIRCMLALRAN